jgi:hypothetical protein
MPEAISRRFVVWGDDDTEQTVVVLPTRLENCKRCEGRGIRKYWAIDGVYGGECDECYGECVVEVVDRARAKLEDLKKYDRTWPA